MTERRTRRDFLVLGAAGAASLGLGARIAARLDDDERAPSELELALSRARKRGVPLLVLVTPEPFLEGIPYDRGYEDGQPLWWWADNPEFYRRGEVLGQWLAHGDDRAMAHLALCELVCAPLAELSAVLPKAELDGDPLLCLVEAARPGTRVVSLDPELPEVPEHCGWGDDEEAYTEKVQARIAALALAVNQALAADRVSLQQRASEASAAGTPLEKTAAFRLMVAVTMESSAAQEERLAELAALGASVRKSPPPGAHWASSLGCGVEIEGAQEDVGIACGMGFVPEVSRRFLAFYTGGE